MGREPSPAMDAEYQRHRAEQLTNGVYGAILVTAFLGAVDERVSSPGEILGELVGASVVIFLAHTYASLLGAGVAEVGHWRGHIRAIIGNQLPLMFAVAIPAIFLVLAALGALTLDAAILLGVAAGIGGLFILGYLLAYERGRPVGFALVAGLIGAALGAAVITLEAGLHH